MNGVKKLLLIRKKDIRSSLIRESGFAKFVKQDPVPITPIAWDLRRGLSHYGYILEGLNLTDLETLQEWEDKHTGATTLDLNPIKEGKKEREQTVDEVLAQVGLRVNTLGPDKDVEKAAVAETVKK